MGKLVYVLAALVCSLALIVHTSPYGTVQAVEEEAEVDNAEDAISSTDDELESERQLKRMLTYVTPLMAILRSQPKRQARSVRSDSLRPANYYDREVYNPYDRNGGYGGGYGGGGGSYCCQQKDDLLPLLALLGLAGLLLYLILIASTTTTAAGRKKRFVSGEDENLIDLTDDDNIVLLDGPTWLSMVHELWEQDAALENTVCTQETLCRMNRLAMAAPGQAGWAVSLSSLPLSYLLHARHTGGFSSYMDAALMGRSGANCTELYKSCPRLSY